jgi:molybdopterin molybdotransferase
VTRLVCPSWDEARGRSHAAGRVLPSEIIPIGAGDGRVLASDVRARTPLPPRDASAMDGWAVCGTGPWRIVDVVLAGDDWSRSLADGEAVGIATGAALPEGATGVLRSEHGTEIGDGRIDGAISPRQDVRPTGEEAEVGELLIASGTLLGPAHLGLASAAGHDELVVVRRPRARMIVFGDELLRSGVARSGKVRDSLGAQVPAWLRRMGVEVIGIDWVEDAREAHVRALEACLDADLVVTSGGTAAGPVDYLRVSLQDTGGEAIIDTVDVRPGSPMLLGQWPDARWLIGLPGNPQAAIVALLTLGLPLVASLSGQPLAELGIRTLDGEVASRGDRLRLVLCRDDALVCRPVDYIGSGMLRGLAAAQGFAVVEGGQGRTGQPVRWLPLP